MQKAELIAKILAIKTEMEPLAIKWAKISKKRFDVRFDLLDDMTIKELTDRYKSLKAIQTGSWTDLQKVWVRLPQAQWETTFALGMRHLPEYTDLRRALSAFKDQFTGKKTDDAKSQPVKS